MVLGIIFYIFEIYVINFVIIFECFYRGIFWSKFKGFKESIFVRFGLDLFIVFRFELKVVLGIYDMFLLF